MIGGSTLLSLCVKAERFSNWQKQDVIVNADMGPAEVQEFCRVDESSRQLLKTAVQQMNLSARAYHRILKLARTIADLANAQEIQAQHVAEALQYRQRDAML